MGVHDKINAVSEERFTSAFDKLGDRDALRLLHTLAQRFSGCMAYDRLASAIEGVAAELADLEGWQKGAGENDAHLAERYLADDTSRYFRPHPMVSVSGADWSGADWHGEVFGG